MNAHGLGASDRMSVAAGGWDYQINNFREMGSLYREQKGVVPETSCDRGHKYLDRSLVVPTVEHTDLAFFASAPN